MELLEAVERSTKKHPGGKTTINWNNVRELMGDGFSKETYRSRYRRLTGNLKDNSKIRHSVSRAFKKGLTDSRDIIAKQIQRTVTIDELCYATKLTQLEVLGHIEQLRIEGFDIVQSVVGTNVCYQSNKKMPITYHEFKHFHNVEKKIKIGIISDTHIGSNYFQKMFLDLAYEDFKNNGVTEVYHCGDITEGMYTNRPDSIYEMNAIGFDQQVDAVKKNYPKVDGITTFFITGNHDSTHMKNGGANVGKAISKDRLDMIYLGHENAKVWLTEKVDLDLVHPRDGSSYAYSYKPQKRIDAMSGGSKPKIMAIGHYHKNITMFYRNIWVLQLASFQAQSPFMRGMGLVSDVGYIILELTVNNNGDIIEFIPRYKALYEMIIE